MEPFEICNSRRYSTYHEQLLPRRDILHRTTGRTSLKAIPRVSSVHRIPGEPVLRQGHNSHRIRESHRGHENHQGHNTNGPSLPRSQGSSILKVIVSSVYVLLSIYGNIDLFQWHWLSTRRCGVSESQVNPRGSGHVDGVPRKSYTVTVDKRERMTY